MNKMIHLCRGAFFLFTLAVAGNLAAAEDNDPSAMDSREKLFDALERSAEAGFADNAAAVEAQWNRMEAAEEKKWKDLERAVLQKWDSYRETTNKSWVDYDADHEAVSQVNFETGEVVVEVLVPDGATQEQQQAALNNKLKVLQEARDAAGKPVMEDLLPPSAPSQIASGAAITARPTIVPGQGWIKPLKDGAAHVQQQAAPNDKLKVLQETGNAAEKPVKEELSPPSAPAQIAGGAAIMGKPTVVQGQDGIKRLKVSATLAMVPDHISRQAKKYLPAVDSAAETTKLDPALVLAIIHTESAFNPMARSPVPAFGLMQIVPRFAGKEAYMQLYGKNEVLPPEYLYKPDNNILLGTTYLERLFNTYFKDVEDADKQRYLVICAYNWGPTAVRKKVLDKTDVNAMEPDKVRQYLSSHAPEETRNYLKRVEERRLAYVNKN